MPSYLFLVFGLVIWLASYVEYCQSQSYPTGPTWASYWQSSLQVPWTIRNDVSSVPRCNPLQCCCPQNTLSTYNVANDPGSLYFNGSFYSQGRLCAAGTSDGPLVLSDNLNIPSSGYVTQELFGVDVMTLTLTNAISTVYGAGQLLLYAQNMVSPQCSFVATKPGTLNPLSGDVCYNNGPCGLHGTCQEPSGTCTCQSGYNGPICLLSDQEVQLSSPWLGTYQTKTLNDCATDPSCCCLQGSVNIYMDPSGSSRIYINGTGLGQQCQTVIEQDDFPIPIPSAPLVSAAPLWDNGDPYVLTLSQSQSSVVELTMIDIRDRDCSMVMVRQGTIPDMNANGSTMAPGIVAAISILSTLSIVFACFVCMYLRRNRRWRKEGWNSSLQMKGDPHSDDRRPMTAFKVGTEEKTTTPSSGL